MLGSAGIYVVDKTDLLSGKSLEYKLLNGDSGLEKALTPNAWNYIDEIIICICQLMKEW